MIRETAISEWDYHKDGSKPTPPDAPATGMKPNWRDWPSASRKPYGELETKQQNNNQLDQFIMQIFIITNDTASDYEQESTILGTFFSKETAQKQFNELREHLHRKYTDKLEIRTDTDSCFEAYRDGYAAQEHEYIALHTMETTTDRDSPFVRLTDLDKAQTALEQEIRNESIKAITDKLNLLNVPELDFSLLTDESDNEDCLPCDEANENRIGIDRWDKHDFWYSVYPTKVQIEEENKPLVFKCTEDNETCLEHEIDSSEMSSEELSRIARMLLFYFDDPTTPVKTVVDGQNAKFTL